MPKNEPRWDSRVDGAAFVSHWTIKPAELDKVITETAKIVSTRAAAFPLLHATSADKDWGMAELRAEIASLL